MPKELSISTLPRGTSPATSMSPKAVVGLTAVQAGAIAAAINAILIGSDVKVTASTPELLVAGSQVRPNSVHANRGNKWQFKSFVPATGKFLKHRIGCADSTQLPSANADTLDLTTGVGLAIKTEWDSYILDDYDNAVELVEIRQVNENLQTR